MSEQHGKNADLLLDGLEIASFLNSADLSADVDTGETSHFKEDWKTFLAGMVTATVEVGGMYDPGFTALPATLGQAAPGSILTVGPAGLAVGQQARLVRVVATAYKESMPVGDIVAFNWSVQADGQVGFGVVIAELTAITADGDGPAHTGPVGGSTTGAIAHLHVTGVSAGDTITVKLQDSANNIAWADIAGGAFALQAAPGAQRLVIPGTIRRYTRASFDVAGASVSIPTAVFLART